MAVASPSRSARRKSRCNSSNGSIDRSHGLSNALGLLRLVQKDRKFGDLLVPFNETGDSTEARDGPTVEIPHRWRHGRAVVIDEKGSVVTPIDEMPGEVNLGDAIGRERIEIRGGVEAEIGAGNVDVVDVTEETAAGPPHELGQEFRLGNRRMAEPQIGGWILHKDRPAEDVLHMPDVAGDDIERLLGVRQRQEIVEVAAVDDAPGEMLGDEKRLRAPNQAAQALQVLGIDPVSAAKRRS